MKPKPFSELKNFTVPCATNTRFSARLTNHFGLLANPTVLRQCPPTHDARSRVHTRKKSHHQLKYTCRVSVCPRDIPNSEEKAVNAGTASCGATQTWA